MRAFEQFRANPAERTFAHPIAAPTQPTGFCPCDRSLPGKAWFYWKATLLLLLLKTPFEKLKLAYLRLLGACIGRNVHLAYDVWLDPAFLDLLTIEDDVMIGVGAKIFMHEFTRTHFRAGRVSIRRGAVVGGFALIGHGVEIGPEAIVAGGAVVGRDVPTGMTAIGNPARLVPQAASGKEAPHE